MHDKSNIYPELKILSPLEQTWASYRRNPLAMAGLWCFGLLLLVTLIGPLVIPYGIDDQHSNHLVVASFVIFISVSTDLLTTIMYPARRKELYARQD